MRGEYEMNDHQHAVRRRPTERLGRFLREDAGAVTVDWVVLTAAIVLLGVAAAFTVSANVPVLANKISDVVESQTVMPD